jgi:dTDP-3-amino-3,4,6-trideoxy-alpha-D-glucose transaminase
VRAALTTSTRVVMVVHLFGNVAPVAEIEALGVPVLEDAAQALGSRAGGGRRAGTLGTAATFSFFPSKNLAAFGDGGAAATPDPSLAEAIAMLRFHGSRDKVSFELVGHNSRLDELQAALLRLELPHLDAWCDGRRAAAGHYADAGLGELAALPEPVDGCDPAWHLYVIRHERSDALAEALAASRRRSPPPGSAARRTTACRCTARRRCGRGRTSSCRAPTRRRAPTWRYR